MTPMLDLVVYMTFAYLPIYLAGIIYVRSLVWGVGVAGLAMMVMPLL